MPQSLSKIYMHCVFSTKKRMPLITSGVRDDLHSYMVGTLSKLGSYVYATYANPDHVHILCTLPRTITVAELMSKVKSSSSRWMKTKGINNFSWQDGYGAFSVSSSKLGIVKNYIINQAEHHKRDSFQDELRKFFQEYELEYDERYVWD